MNIVKHTSAKPSHYNKDAKHYDVFNEMNSCTINLAIEKILKKYRVKSVLDLACGTGSQVFWLANRGYEVIGSDINQNMLKIARSKAKKQKSAAKFIKGDMRTLKTGKFDAVITIFNAIGHLTQRDFEKAMRNIYKNLNDNGLYVFDIFNLSYFLKDDNITKLTIDWKKNLGNSTVREIQYSTISQDGILASYNICHEQTDNKKPKITTDYQTLQIYSAKQLKEMLQKNGFKVLGLCGFDGSRFVESKTERIVMIAMKR